MSAFIYQTKSLLARNRIRSRYISTLQGLLPFSLCLQVQDLLSLIQATKQLWFEPSRVLLQVYEAKAKSLILHML